MRRIWRLHICFRWFRAPRPAGARVFCTRVPQDWSATHLGMAARGELQLACLRMAIRVSSPVVPMAITLVAPGRLTAMTFCPLTSNTPASG